MNELYNFISMVKAIQPCTQNTIEFRGHGKYKKYIEPAFKLKLIENSTYTNSVGEKIITVTSLGEKFLNKEINIKTLLEEQDK